MKHVFIFPGQGSQFPGMGKELFANYAAEVKLASDVLGYAIDELCLYDRHGKLGNTEYTQPALFFVNVLHYLEERQFDSVDCVSSSVQSDLVFSGHSLGEYCALFAAGAFDLAVGLRLVKKRGELMSTAPKGAMAAIMDIDQKQVRKILVDHGLDLVDIANINTKTQTIISGLYEDIVNAESVFVKNNARYIFLNVSAAFHSRYMAPIAAKFAEYLDGENLRPLTSIVISNLTARPYPDNNYKSLMVDQINHPVQWYESMSYLMAEGIEEFTELGPGFVLTRMHSSIKADPMLISANPSELRNKSSNSQTLIDEQHTRNELPVYLMFAGQGTQYYGMGAELYRFNSSFRKAMNECDRILYGHLGYSIVDEIYQLDADQAFDYIGSTHPAIVSFGYSLYKVFEEASQNIEGVIGHSLGEYIAAIAAGVISLEDCLEMVCIQARLLENKADPGSLISVLADHAFVSSNPKIFENVQLAAENSPKNVMFSGKVEDIDQLLSVLERLGITSVKLPVDYAFHSDEIDSIKSEFIASCAHIQLARPKLKLFSCNTGAYSDVYTIESFWRAVREPVQFSHLVNGNVPQGHNLIDLSSTGSLSAFIRQCPIENIESTHVVNQFGNNISTLHAALEMIA